MAVNIPPHRAASLMLSLCFQSWHKGCFRCWECGMALNMRTYKGINKLPYCEA